MKIGDKVVFKKEIKALRFGEVGIISHIGIDFCEIAYPQNFVYEDDGKGGFKEKKDYPKWQLGNRFLPYISHHSAKFDEITII